jgi:hypothetical protein
VLNEPGALEELMALGTRQLPVVAKAGKWVNGQSLKAVADLLGIDLGGVQHLPQVELVRRIDRIVEAAGRFIAQFPEERLADLVPGRPRSYGQLGWHLFNVVDAFLEHENGMRLEHEAYNRVPAPGSSRADILAYGEDVRRRFAAWWEKADRRPGYWTAKADVYYGDVSRHEYLERTTWHSGQHSRQLMWILEGKLGITPNGPLEDAMWKGLPMPEQVWDS